MSAVTGTFKQHAELALAVKVLGEDGLQLIQLLVVQVGHQLLDLLERLCK